MGERARADDRARESAGDRGREKGERATEGREREWDREGDIKRLRARESLRGRVGESRSGREKASWRESERERE